MKASATQYEQSMMDSQIQFIEDDNCYPMYTGLYCSRHNGYRIRK